MRTPSPVAILLAAAPPQYCNEDRDRIMVDTVERSSSRVKRVVCDIAEDLLPDHPVPRRIMGVPRCGSAPQLPRHLR